jgi:hypothetical protein
MAADDGGSQGPDAPRARLTIIVDGANVVGSRPDGWWRDRAGAAVRLYDDLLRLAARGVTGVSDDASGTGEGGGGDEPGGGNGPGGTGGGPGGPGGGPGGPGGADGGGSGGATALDGAWQVAEVVLVLEGAARAAVPRITARARAAEGGHSPVQSGSREGEGGAGGIGESGGVSGGASDPAGPVRVVSAPGSGDDEIVRLVRSLPGRRIVVTADRELRRRCEEAGAEVTSPSWLYGLL